MNPIADRKQPLLRETPHGWRARVGRIRAAGILTMALPFYKGYHGLLFHRVRSGILHKQAWREDRPNAHHISIKFWCGNGGFLDGQGPGRRHGGELFAETPENAIHCAICEGKATGAGLVGVRKINGRNVLYSPRI